MNTITTPDVLKLSGMTKAALVSLVRRGQLPIVTQGSQGCVANTYDADLIAIVAALVRKGMTPAAAAHIAQKAHCRLTDDGSVIIS